MKKKCSRIMAALLSMLMFVGIAPLDAFAWGTQGQVCSSAFGGRYVGADGDNYYSASTYDYIVYDSNGNTTLHTMSGGNARKKYMLVDANGTSHFVYCIESGVEFSSSTNAYTSSSGTNSNYFQNLPRAAREGIQLTTVYGWQEGKHTPVAGTNDDDYAVATQIILWEYQQQLRTSPTRIEKNGYGTRADNFSRTIKGRPAEKCYNWILEQMANHLVTPSFTGKTHTLKYNPSTKQYSLTLTDANNTYIDLKLTNANGISVSRSGNKYTFTSSKMITNAVTVSAQKNIPTVDGNMLIWGRPGKQTMMCGSQDPIVMTIGFKTETYGVCKIIKTSEDNNVAGIKFRITGNGVNEVVTTTANGKGEKKAYWRCLNHMENGNAGCPQAKGIEEELLHNAICRGLTKCISETGDVKQLVASMLAYATSEDEMLLECQSVETAIKELKEKANDAEEMCIRTQGNKEPYMEQIKKYYASIAQLRERVEEIKTQLKSNEDFQNEMNQINSWLADDEISFAEYDDEIVRYLVESIRVSDDLKLTINIKGGGTVVEEICPKEE